MTRDPGRPAAAALDAILPTNPLAALSCWIGIGAGALCFLLGVVFRGRS